MLMETRNLSHVDGDQKFSGTSEHMIYFSIFLCESMGTSKRSFKMLVNYTITIVMV